MTAVRSTLLASAVTLVALALVAAGAGALARLDALAFDARLRAGGPRVPSREIVLVGLDEQSRRELEEPSCHFNVHYARLVRGLTDAGARVIGFDVLQPRAFPALEDEQADLAEAMQYARERGRGLPGSVPRHPLASSSDTEAEKYRCGNGDLAAHALLHRGELLVEPGP